MTCRLYPLPCRGESCMSCSPRRDQTVHLARFLRRHYPDQVPRVGFPLSAIARKGFALRDLTRAGTPGAIVAGVIHDYTRHTGVYLSLTV